MRSDLTLEHGIIRYFRIFTFIQFNLGLASFLLFESTNNWTTTSPFFFIQIISLLFNGSLIIYLSLPQLLQILRNKYLPIGILWATFWPTFQFHSSFTFITNNPDKSTLLTLFLSEFFLYIPLIITAWQYPRKRLLGYCGFTMILDGMMAFLAYQIFHNIYSLRILSVTFGRTVLFLLIGILISNLMQIQREQRQSLLDANKRLTQNASTLEQLTTSRERNRMARELHDILAHTLSGVAVELEGVRSVMNINPDEAERLVGHSLIAVREGLSETRLALQDLRASPLKDIGLGLAIRNLAESLPLKSGIQIDIQIENGLHDYPEDVQHCFYRVAQEAFMNIVDHSSAHNVQIRLFQENQILTLSILDDGIGFNLNNIDSTQKFGILGMRERAEMINGTLSITSKIKSGTLIKLSYKIDQ
jgi:signal transduction histidine kinase